MTAATRRPLPAIYSTGKAVNYSPYRTAGGPITSEVPSDAEILQDLTLLNTAGFDLLRLFGARAPATDVVAEKILRIAAQNFPDMKFQLGVELKGLTSCSQTDNDYNIAYLISNLSKYPNVVTISVGNETSFFSRYMPLPCLEGYIRTIRSQVTQPVTADDDWTFYAGKATFETSERVPVKPDTILNLIDFASIHMYPISYTVWDWRQTSVPEGPARAKAMMETSLVALKEWYGEVVDYQYVGADGVTVSVGDSMPITVGETGWKARQTNPAAEIEAYAARPENAKWYFDLLYGNPGGYPAWQGSTDGPPTIFYFEAFDEHGRASTTAGACGTSRDRHAMPCAACRRARPVTMTCMRARATTTRRRFRTITFDSTRSPTRWLASAVPRTPRSWPIRPADQQGGAGSIGRRRPSPLPGPLSARPACRSGSYRSTPSNTRMSVRVYSPAEGIRVRLKVEDSANSARSVETEAVTTAAGLGDADLRFRQSVRPAALNLNVTDTTGDHLLQLRRDRRHGRRPDVSTSTTSTFIGGGGLPVIGQFSDLTFDSAGVVYTLTGFAGAEDSLVASPIRPTPPTRWSGSIVRRPPKRTPGPSCPRDPTRRSARSRSAQRTRG